MKRFGKLAALLTAAALSLSLSAFGASAALDSAEDAGSGEPVVCTGGVYGDIAGGWYESWVNTYGCPEIFSAGDGLFHPDRAVTRMELARLLHAVLDIEINYFAAPDIGDYFDDVPAEDPGAGALIDLVTCGILKAGGAFRPGDSVPRDEMIGLVMDAFRYRAGENFPIPLIARLPFDDDGDIAETYKSDVYTAAVLGLVTGTGDNLLLPKDAATRAQAVTLAGRLAELLEGRENGVAVTASMKEAEGALLVTLSIRNGAENAVTILHNTAQTADFLLTDQDGAPLLRWSDGRMFAAVVTQTVIAPGGEAVFVLRLEPEDWAGLRGRTAGITAFIAGASADFEINPDGYEVPTDGNEALPA